jgi:hypothetical protein
VQRGVHHVERDFEEIGSFATLKIEREERLAVAVAKTVVLGKAECTIIIKPSFIYYCRSLTRFPA